jgi:BirA family transcriptional regulator, biotin operon repressor / biotin---[acetyl-CoA-carboxylase] ligase
VKIFYQHFESLTSTNDWAKNRLSDFPINALTIISTDSQTAGRGQYGRRWLSPVGKNLNASFIFFSQHEMDALLLTRIMALCAIEQLKACGIVCALKWPNDLVMAGKKIAGILSEKVQSGVSQALVIGLGLNVNVPLEWLEQIDQPATSMFAETAKKYDIQKLIVSLAENFALKLESLQIRDHDKGRMDFRLDDLLNC